MPGDDFIILPEPQTAVNISSKDTMNITISKCCLAVFSNLAKVILTGKRCLLALGEVLTSEGLSVLLSQASDCFRTLRKMLPSRSFTLIAL